MKIVSSLLLLIGALAVLTLGALGVSASPAMAEAPCHEASHAAPDQTPDHSGKPPGKPMKAMACCVACVAAPNLDPASDSAPTVAPARLTAPLFNVPAGLLLSPEPGPPRLLIA
ncbi:MAG: hypothetical protein A2795_07230 [Caulobacterales bacterium RIFCSPHIGHO2_01_FULL_67_30]|nr:MAG: hypothetical protein A2795_07230 [Caulobacterales bacterium RIFCSPHIGHO2_01_FULL_67_30]